MPRLFGSLMGEDGRLPVGEAVWGDTWANYRRSGCTCSGIMW